MMSAMKFVLGHDQSRVQIYVLRDWADFTLSEAGVVVVFELVDFDAAAVFFELVNFDVAASGMDG